MTVVGMRLGAKDWFESVDSAAAPVNFVVIPEF